MRAAGEVDEVERTLPGRVVVRIDAGGDLGT